MRASKRTRREASELFGLCLVGGVLDVNRVRQVVQDLVSTKPKSYLNTLSCFQRLVKLHCALHAAKVESAMPLSDELRTYLKQGLERMYGPELDTSFVANPDLIGGLRIQVGSDVYDGSVRGRLGALQESFEAMV
jgi:F-type H+-transporting ATPase subunit delta